MGCILASALGTNKQSWEWLHRKFNPLRGDPVRTMRGVVTSKESGVPVIAVSASTAGTASGQRRACVWGEVNRNAGWIRPSEGLTVPYPEICDWDVFEVSR